MELFFQTPGPELGALFNYPFVSHDAELQPQEPFVEIPNILYAGHHLIKAVKSGTIPIAPHQLLK